MGPRWKDRRQQRRVCADRACAGEAAGPVRRDRQHRAAMLAPQPRAARRAASGGMLWKMQAIGTNARRKAPIAGHEKYQPANAAQPRKPLRKARAIRRAVVAENHARSTRQ
jgi:hypothetical protein